MVFHLHASTSMFTVFFMLATIFFIWEILEFIELKFDFLEHDPQVISDCVFQLSAKRYIVNLNSLAFSTNRQDFGSKCISLCRPRGIKILQQSHQGSFGHSHATDLLSLDRLHRTRKSFVDFDVRPLIGMNLVPYGGFNRSSFVFTADESSKIWSSRPWRLQFLQEVQQYWPKCALRSLSFCIRFSEFPLLLSCQFDRSSASTIDDAIGDGPW